MKSEPTRLDRPIVVGSGVAGVTVALGIGSAMVLSGREMGSSWWSQAGLAVSLSPEDSPEDHGADTLGASGGIGDPVAVDALTADAPAAIDKLAGLGVAFDRNLEGELILSQERGHRHPRVVRSDGDATGAELIRSLLSRAGQADDVDLSRGRVVDLVSDGDRVAGVVVAEGRHRHVLLAPAVILATGGAGRLYSQTTNPSGITGDGIALAARAGAVLADLEFVRFHPTALRIGKDPLPALPGGLFEEGALLVDGSGRPFLSSVSESADSHTADALARVVYSRSQSGSPVYVDPRPVTNFSERYPTPTAHAMSAGFDPVDQLLPVTPAAHMFIGGVRTDSYGRTSVPGLWAVGECASTGVHGAAGLEANALLESVVFGMRTAESVRSDARFPVDHVRLPEGSLDLPVVAGPAVEELRQVMWDHVGPVRSASGLQEAMSALMSMEVILNRTIEGRNLLILASMVIAAAEGRTESRGVHFRADHPSADPSQQSRSETRSAPAGWIDGEARPAWLDFS